MARCFRSFLRDYCGWCPGLNQRRNIASTWWITPEGEVESHCEDNREENREKYIFLWLFSLIKLTVYLLSYYFLRKEILLTATLNAFPFFFFFFNKKTLWIKVIWSNGGTFKYQTGNVSPASTPRKRSHIFGAPDSLLQKKATSHCYEKNGLVSDFWSAVFCCES